MKKKIIVAGHICLDITPGFEDCHERPINELLTPGKLVNLNGAYIQTGGVVSNTGIALKKLGADVLLIGKIGEDPIGQLVQKFMLNHDSNDCIVDKSVSTSYTIALAVPGSDRILLYNAGANNYFYCDDIPDTAFENVILFHFGYPQLMKSMYDNEGDELLKLYKRVKEKGIQTSLDTAFIDPGSESDSADWNLILGKVLPYVDYFEPSFEEICYMLDRKKFLSLSKPGADIVENIDFINDVKPLADKLITMGPKVVLIKCGRSGMYYKTATEEGIQKAYKVKKMRSATGAGDVSIAAFLYAVLENRPIKECVALAAAEGACSVTEYDSYSGIRSFKELEEIIKQNSSEPI